VFCDKLLYQWGNGLKLIADELKEYPEIEFKWFESGLQFQFLKKDYKPDGVIANNVCTF
jgi:ATP-dependent DNA helicase RecG